MVQRSGSFPIDAFIGVVVGHLYFYIDQIYPRMNNGVKLISTPDWLRRFFPDPPNAGGNVPRSPGSGGGQDGERSWGRGNRLG